MGNSIGKKKSIRRTGSKLTISEVSRINKAIYNLPDTDLTKGLNAEVVEKLWKDDLVPSLLKQYKNYLFPFQNSKCSVDEIAELYGLLVRGDYEEKACLLTKVIGETQQCLPVHINLVVKYVADVIESYLCGMEKRKSMEYISWLDVLNNTSEESILNVAKGWTEDIERENDIVSLESIERWINSCGVLASLHREQFNILFNIDSDENTSFAMFPLLKNPDDLNSDYSVLHPAHILHLNYLLPQDLQIEWRFLFSTVNHGESFSMLLGKIIDKGPTILVISDESGHVFGGFASHSWTLSPKFQGSEKCFLFTIQPEVKVYHPTGYNNHYMYINYHQQSLPNGLGMGGQFNYWGLWISAEFGHGECSDVCTTFQNYKKMSGNKKFTIRKLEIWGVGHLPDPSENSGEKVGVLDKDPAARKILEMAGKDNHSAGIREQVGNV